MRCPHCKIDAILFAIKRNGETETHSYVCRNPKCRMNGKTIGEVTADTTGMTGT